MYGQAAESDELEPQHQEQQPKSPCADGLANAQPAGDLPGYCPVRDRPFGFLILRWISVGKVAISPRFGTDHQGERDTNGT